VLVTGIARAAGLQTYVEQTFGCAEHIEFSDHHAYTPADIARILKRTPTQMPILTTEKDWVKLDGLINGPGRARWFYLPVALYFLNREADFTQLLR
jgi:tetraacyldisaccharide 4'-kinase